MKRNGYVIYEGPSMFDGSPIVAIVTMKSENVKTGPMNQLWILKSDIDPINTSRMGLDNGICGDCPLKRSAGGACYVTLFQGPLNVYKAFKTGKYINLSVDGFEVFRGVKMRFGAYGDPAMLPIEILEGLKANVGGFTGYSHQWKERAVQGYVMASVESISDKNIANKMGYRTFRVLGLNDNELASDEIICPNYTNDVQCVKCGLCDGVKGVNDKRKNIAIPVHGILVNKFAKKNNVTELIEN